MVQNLLSSLFYLLEVALLIVERVSSIFFYTIFFLYISLFQNVQLLFSSVLYLSVRLVIVNSVDAVILFLYHFTHFLLSCMLCVSNMFIVFRVIDLMSL